MPNLLIEYIRLLKSNYKYARRKQKIKKEVDPKEVAHLLPKVNIKKKWYGSVYGGFFVHPDLLNSHSVVYSFGIGTDISFDLKCISRHSCGVFGFDPTPRSINWVATHSISEKFKFYDYGISKVTGPHSFLLPKAERGISGSLVVNPLVSNEKKIQVQMKSFADITRDLGHSKVDLVKMDIEGAEYEVIDSLLSSGVQIDQFLVEFHDRFFQENNYPSRAVVEKLVEHGFIVFGCSDSYEEVSFIRESLVKKNI